MENIYTDGSYLEKTGGTWHLEDSPYKAQQVLTLLRRHPNLPLNTLCEIGSGAGGILHHLQAAMPQDIEFTGYEISPQAYSISGQFANEKCHFIMGDAFQDDSVYDLVLVADVVEHVEDYFTFLRNARGKGRTKLYHIPIDAHASAILRGVNAWDDVGHIHTFTIETALKSVEHTGHRILDWRLFGIAFSPKRHPLSTRIANVARRMLEGADTKLAARLIGGYTIQILAE